MINKPLVYAAWQKEQECIWFRGGDLDCFQDILVLFAWVGSGPSMEHMTYIPFDGPDHMNKNTYGLGGWLSRFCYNFAVSGGVRTTPGALELYITSCAMTKGTKICGVGVRIPTVFVIFNHFQLLGLWWGYLMYPSSNCLLQSRYESADTMLLSLTVFQFVTFCYRLRFFP